MNKTCFCVSPFCRHTTTASGNEIDAAAMEFDRRFHISVDASEDREQQVYNPYAHTTIESCDLFSFTIHYSRDGFVLFFSNNFSTGFILFNFFIISFTSNQNINKQK